MATFATDDADRPRASRAGLPLMLAAIAVATIAAGAGYEALRAIGRTLGQLI